MIIANVHKAKTELSKLIEAVLNGEEVMIAKNGEPKVRLVEYVGPVKRKSSRGILKGKVLLNDHTFDDEDPEINKLFGVE